MVKFKSVLACLVLLVTGSLARAELVVEVTQGVAEPSPVAVVPFNWSGTSALPEDVAKVVEQDLARSGFFSALPRESMLGFPSRQSDVYFRDWRVSGSDYLLIGRIEPLGEQRLEINFELYDVLKEQRLMGQRVESTPAQLRDAAHYIADRIFEGLTGLKGAFSTRIVYVTADRRADNSNRYRLMLSDWDGARPRTILESSEPIMSPTWSGDGSKLAYVSFETGRPAIYVQYLSTGKRERIQSFKGLNGAPSWSPDGNQLALVLSKDGNPEIYVLDMRSRQLQRVTRHYGIDTEPTWAPDGQSLLFTSDRGGQPQIYRLNLSSRDLERLTWEGNYNARPRLTQDGRFLAMVHRPQGGDFTIAVQDLKSGRLDILTRAGLDESPSIAPNGSIIIYASQEQGKGVLAAVSLDGQVRFRMPSPGGDVREPAWSPFLQ
ncbi:MAG: Tol-Pal system beta propeller repeat protein TolB [Oceanospirillaceae bacterium]|nr:Tol-Pal system beta propeller repeat protein TolB [Oceanospirillaceae bacterium]